MKTKSSLLLLSVVAFAVFAGAQAFASSTFPFATGTSYQCTGTAAGTSPLACLAPGNIIVTNSIIDVGQYTFISVNGIEGGNAPYTGNWAYLSTNTPLSNTIQFDINTTSASEGTALVNTILEFNPQTQTQAAVTAYNGFTAATNTVVSSTNIFGIWTFNAFFKDTSATTFNTFITSNTIFSITVYNSPSQTLYITAPNSIKTNSIPYGTAGITVTNDITSGGSATFSFAWLLDGAKATNTIIGTSQSYNTINTPSLTPGNYIFAVNTVDTGTTTYDALAVITNTLVITANSALTATCTGGGFVGYYTWSTVTCTGTATLNNQSSWGLYVDGTLLNKTSSVASWTQETQSGLHTILFKNLGNANYTNYTAGTTLKVGSLGTGGTPGGVVGPITTTSATTVSTTISTTTVPQILNQSGSIGISVSESAPVVVSFPGMGVHFTINSNSTTKGNVTVYASNATATSPSAPANYTKLAAFNVSSASVSVTSIMVSYAYQCGANASALQPYILENGTWIAIPHFSVNSTTCSISFAVSRDPVVAIMQHNAAAPTTTVQPTTTVLPTTTVAQASAPQGNGGTTAAASVVVVIIVVVIVVAALAMKNKKGKGRR